MKKKKKEPSFRQGIYRHFSGKLYWFSGEYGRNAISQEDEAEYYPLYQSDIRKWHRPIVDCLDKVSKGQYNGPRFTFLTECNAKHLILPGSQVIHSDVSRDFWCKVVSLEEVDEKVIVKLERHKHHQNLKGAHAAISEQEVPLKQFLQTYIPFK